MADETNVARQLYRTAAGDPLMQFDLKARTMRVMAAPRGGVYIDFPALADDTDLGFFRVNLPAAAAKKLIRTLRNT